LAKVSASRIGDVMAVTKSGASERRKRYMMELVSERLTGQAISVPINAAMQRGIDLEPEARLIVSKTMKDFEITEASVYDHPTIKMACASPDGLIGKYGLLEVKCQGQLNHTKFLATQKIPKDHELQMLWQQACQPERLFSLYVVYNPEFPVKLQLGVQKLHRDNKKIKELENEVVEFLDEVEATITKIKGE
jgi:hypothetical protein